MTEPPSSSTLPVDAGRRQAILSVAGRLFAQRGYHGTSIRDIAHASDLVALRDECTALWQQVLDDGRRDGALRRDVDTGAVLWVVLSAITGLVDGRYDDLAEEARAVPIGTLIDVLLDGLRG